MNDLRDIIDHYAQRGQQLIVEWDAGGDETLMWVRDPDSRPGEQKILKFPPLEEALDLICHELQLPNAGEHFHQGRGELLLDENREAFIQFNSRDYCLVGNYHWDEENVEDGSDPRAGRMMYWHYEGERPIESGQYMREVDIEPDHRVESILHRAEVALCGEMDQNGNQNAQIWIEVINGDKVELPEEVRRYYLEKVADVLEDCRSLFDGTSPSPVGVYVEGRLRDEPRVRFQILTTAYHTLNIYNAARLALSRKS